MKGFVPTPLQIVDLMVDKLFASGSPSEQSRVLDPGCGPGAFVEGVLRWCSLRSVSPPRIVGIDSDPEHVASARARFLDNERVEIRQADFLVGSHEQYDYVIGNPPYVAITGLSEAERCAYRQRYLTATNRFDLYVLFLEEAIRQLKPGGKLVFITPEKFLYVESAAAIRRLLAQRRVEELHFLSEDTFADLVTYPLVTTLTNSAGHHATSVILRHGEVRQCHLNVAGLSWLPSISGDTRRHSGSTLADISLRVSCGVATGSDGDYVIDEERLTDGLRPFAFPTISGRQLVGGRAVDPRHYMLVPYDRAGVLLPPDRLGALGKYLSDPARKARLLARTCARRKAWYAFHENPPMRQLLRPKILCKDIGSAPFFFIDRKGVIIPRHSVYYVLPRRVEHLEPLREYLNSPAARGWLMQNCQRAAKGFVRLQSHVLKRMPVPQHFDTQPGLEIGVELEEPVTA